MRSACGPSSAPPTPAAGAAPTSCSPKWRERLGNTVAVCKKSYVHPQVLETLATQVDSDALARLGGRRRAGLNAAERRLLAFLGHG